MAARRQRAQFSGEDQIVGGLCRVDQHDITRAGERLDERPNRRDTNASRDHQELAAGRWPGRERSEWRLEQYEGARREMTDATGEVTDGFNRDPEESSIR